MPLTLAPAKTTGCPASNACNQFMLLPFSLRYWAKNVTVRQWVISISHVSSKTLVAAVAVASCYRIRRRNSSNARRYATPLCGAFWQSSVIATANESGEWGENQSKSVKETSVNDRVVHFCPVLALGGANWARLSSIGVMTKSVTSGIRDRLLGSTCLPG